MTAKAWRVAVLAACFLAGGTLRAGLDQVKAEPNLEKRSQLALDNADRALKAVHDAYHKGEHDAVPDLASEVQQSVELAETSLRETGKDPRKSSRWFKKAELQTRGLLKRLENLQQEMSVTDRPVLDPVKARVQEVHDDLLKGLMEGKKK